MSQIRLHITLNRIEAERIYNLLEVLFEDDGYPVAITGVDRSDNVREISVYTDEFCLEDMVNRIVECTDVDKTLLDMEVLPEINWVQHSLKGLQPVRAGRFFVYGAHDRSQIKINDIAIEIEAGQAFGTGHHGTTAGCLEMLNILLHTECPHDGLDLGTGSGVLAIAMAKLWSVRVLATDIDPVATRVAHENIFLNRVSQLVKAVTADSLAHPELVNCRSFDLIVANILAGPLIKMAFSITSVLRKNGTLVLSGILESQRERILSAYHMHGLSHNRTIIRDGWVTLCLK